MLLHIVNKTVTIFTTDVSKELGTADFQLDDRIIAQLFSAARPPISFKELVAKSPLRITEIPVYARNKSSGAVQDDVNISYKNPTAQRTTSSSTFPAPTHPSGLTPITGDLATTVKTYRTRESCVVRLD
jgi:hypothetical protein